MTTATTKPATSPDDNAKLSLEVSTNMVNAGIEALDFTHLKLVRQRGESMSTTHAKLASAVTLIYQKMEAARGK